MTLWRAPNNSKTNIFFSFDKSPSEHVDGWAFFIEQAGRAIPGSPEITDRNFNSLRNYSTVTVEQLTVLEQVKLENADLDR